MVSIEKDLAAVKIEEISKLKETVSGLQKDYENLNARLNELYNQNGKNFDRLFSELKDLSKDIKDVTHQGMNWMVQEGRLNEAEKKLSGIDERFRSLDKELKEIADFEDETRRRIDNHVQEDRVRKETTKENINALEKIGGVVKWLLPAAAAFFAGKLI
mgnify:CR=1 FL=1